MLKLLIQAIGKSRKDPSFCAIQKQLPHFSCIESGENFILNSQEEGLSLTFDENDLLIKIDMAVHQKWYQLLIDEFYEPLKQSIHQTCIIQTLGPPTAMINYPILMGAHKQILYNKEHYWLSMKLKNEKLESISLLLPCLIADNIKRDYVPIRTCKT